MFLGPELSAFLGPVSELCGANGRSAGNPQEGPKEKALGENKAKCTQADSMFLASQERGASGGR